MKRLYHSGKERMLGGVCGDLGEHSDVDPTVIRLVWAEVTTLSGGLGLLIYLSARILLLEFPEKTTDQIPESV